MARKTEEERLAELEAQKLKIEQQMRSITIRQKERSRKDDTRRKVLVGATVLALVDSGQWTGPNIGEMLGKHLTRNSDRALFGLYPITEETLMPAAGKDATT